MTAPVPANIVSSKLVILESKRSLLAKAQNHLHVAGTQQARTDVRRCESDVRRAQGRYNEAVVRWGEPSTAQYRLVAYGSLVDKAEHLRGTLLGAAPNFPNRDRRELLADVESLEAIIASWSEVLRNAMGAVA